jgi:hypothetical protein
MMGDDTPDQSTVWSAPAEVQHILYREITRRMLAARGVTPALACGVGCATCGVIDASPARCEQCNGVHMAGTHRPAPRYDTSAGAVGAIANSVRKRTCRCGVDGCADGQCPGRPV